MTYLLRASDRAGNIGFYTGKAGPEWVNNQIGNAFAYSSLEAARRKATLFNRMEELHHMRFIAIPAVLA
jgi:hypothetical protein